MTSPVPAPVKPDMGAFAFILWHLLRHRKTHCPGSLDASDEIVEPDDVIAQWHDTSPTDAELLASIGRAFRTTLERSAHFIPDMRVELCGDFETDPCIVARWFGTYETLASLPPDVRGQGLTDLARHLMAADAPPEMPRWTGQAPAASPQPSPPPPADNAPAATAEPAPVRSAPVSPPSDRRRQKTVSTETPCSGQLALF